MIIDILKKDIPNQNKTEYTCCLGVANEILSMGVMVSTDLSNVFLILSLNLIELCKFSKELDIKNSKLNTHKMTLLK